MDDGMAIGANGQEILLIIGLNPACRCQHFEMMHLDDFDLQSGINFPEIRSAYLAVACPEVI
jgi:hypothetical protein